MDRIFKLPVGVAVFAALALAGLMGMFAFSAAPTAEAQSTIPYPEMGDGPVATFTARDPEGSQVVAWMLAGDDSGAFNIDGGVLTFKKKPDFEKPADADVNNIYEVSIQATDATKVTGELKVMVQVTNIDEKGTVTLSARQPQSGVQFKAMLDDKDVSRSDTWQWAKSTSMDGPFVDITENGTSATYTPTDLDGGNYLRATATYIDGHGSNKTAMDVSDYAVQRGRTLNNPPSFPNQPADPDDNTAVPLNTEAFLKVTENTPEGRPIGAPIMANDPDSDVLTYTLVSTSPGGITEDMHKDMFDIDWATGQIKTKKDKDLDYDVATGGTPTYMVKIRATDPAGIPDAATAAATNSDEITVTIRITDVDESPVFVMDNSATGTSFDDEIEDNIGINEVLEDGAALTGALVPEDGTAADFQYQALDPENPTGTDAIAVSAIEIRGADAEAFDHDDTSGTLSFTTEFQSPDYEDPKDANKDNVYEVSLVARDSNNNETTQRVTVTIKNANDTGMLTIDRTQPRVGVIITPELTDPDDGITDVAWSWYRRTVGSGACSDLLTDRTDGMLPSEWMMISNKMTYTPGTDDWKSSFEDDDKQCLLVSAMYRDTATEIATDATKDMLDKVSDNPVETGSTDPNFQEPTPGAMEPLTVMETAKAGDPVGSSKSDNDDGNFAYVLSGPDAMYFEILSKDETTTSDVDEAGLIKVGKGTNLDYETKKTYMVKVTATSSFGHSSDVDVTIMVIDVNEGPEIQVGGVTVSGMASVTVGENHSGEVETYTTSADGAQFTALTGADRGDFSISGGGMLSFSSDPNYEAPADANGDNVYMVTVNAKYMTWTDSHDVMVTVDNMDEDGMVTFMSTVARVGHGLTAELDDEDGPTNVKWDWWYGHRRGRDLH